jgi:hypothetical protein
MRQQQYPAYQLGLLGQGLGMMPKLMGSTGTESFRAASLEDLGNFLYGAGGSGAFGGD